MKWSKLLPYGAVAFGSAMILVGAAFVVMYVAEAVVARASEPDQSLLFWYLPILFLGLTGIVIGAGVGVWGISRLKKIRRQVP